MPAYEKLKSGKHSYTVRLPNGKRRRFTDPLKRVAKQQADDFEAAIRRGETMHLRERRLTVAAWHTRWLDGRMVEASTARKDESRWRNYVEPQWGAWPIDSIQRSDVQAWVKALMDAGVGPHPIHGAFELLATMLSAAVDDKLLADTPCHKVKLPKRGKPEPRWLTREEYDRLQFTLGMLVNRRGGRRAVPDPQAPIWQAFVGLGCFSGLRPGELAGLDISAIDFDRRLARVTQVMARLPDGKRPDGRPKYRFGIRRYPKSDRSIRSVPFPDEVGELLWRIVADRAGGPVFTAPGGGRVFFDGNWHSRVWIPALAAAGIEPVRPYVMRHTAASWLVQKGVSDRKIMKILGHADTHLIEVYAHLAPDAHDEVRAAWDDASGSGRPTSAPAGLGSDQHPAKNRRSDGRSVADSAR